MPRRKFEIGQRVEQTTDDGRFVGTVKGYAEDGWAYVKWDRIENEQQVPDDRLSRWRNEVGAFNWGYGADVPALAEVTSAFLRVRSGHDYGSGHGDFAMHERGEAVARAKELIRPLIYSGEVNSWVNYSIEERWVVRYIDGDAMGDKVASGTERPVGSTKVVLTDAEKAAKLAEPENAAQLKKDAA